MRNVLDKKCRENQNTHFMSNSVFFSKILPFEIMSKNMAEQKEPQMTSQYGAYEVNAG